MEQMNKLELEEKVIEMLKTIYDPEIPVNIYDLGLIYRIEINEDASLDIDMTMTSPTCPMSDFIVSDAQQRLESIKDLKKVTINLVFEPIWDKDMMSEEAKADLGFL